MERWRVLAMLVAVLLLIVVATLTTGCEPVQRGMVAAADGNAATARTAADTAAAGNLSKADMVYTMEMLARSAENLRAAAHGNPPVWVAGPANRPDMDALPWVPVGGEATQEVAP